MKIRRTGVLGGWYVVILDSFLEVVADLALIARCDGAGGARARSVVCLNWFKRDAKPDMVGWRLIAGKG